MKKIAYYISVFLLAGIIVIACKKDDDNPPGTDAHTVTGFSPASGAVGTTVTVNGTNFADENISVAFNGTSSSVSSVSTNGQSLTTTVPEGATTGKITVSINGTAVSSSENFTVNVPQIELAATTLEMRTLETVQFPEITNPDDFEDKTPSYQTQNPDIVVVDEDGGLTALQAGEATLSVSLGELSEEVIVTVNPSIFVAGTVEKNDGNSVAGTIWVNGVPMELPDGDTNSTYLYGLSVSGYHIYSSGVVYINDERHTKVWKDTEVLYNLTDGLSSSNGSDIQVENGTVYVAGHEDKIARFWNNSNATVLGEEGKTSYAEDIILNNGDVYVAGIQRNDQNISVAQYWLNGNPVAITDGLKSERANSIAIYNSDVYTAGTGNYSAEDLTMTGRVWKNTELLYEYGDGTEQTEVFSIQVKEGNVYAAGTNYDSNKAMLWVNNTEIELTSGTVKSNGNSVYVHQELAYVCGFKQTEENSEVWEATVWVVYANTGALKEVISYPSSDSLESSYAESIIVK